jgi:hypothetical protein
MIATAIQVADALITNVALPQLEKDLGGGEVHPVSTGHGR